MDESLPVTNSIQFPNQYHFNLSDIFSKCIGGQCFWDGNYPDEEDAHKGLDLHTYTHYKGVIDIIERLEENASFNVGLAFRGVNITKAQEYMDAIPPNFTNKVTTPLIEKINSAILNNILNNNYICNTHFGHSQEIRLDDNDKFQLLLNGIKQNDESCHEIDFGGLHINQNRINAIDQAVLNNDHVYSINLINDEDRNKIRFLIQSNASSEVNPQETNSLSAKNNINEIPNYVLDALYKEKYETSLLGELELSDAALVKLKINKIKANMEPILSIDFSGLKIAKEQRGEINAAILENHHLYSVTGIDHLSSEAIYHLEKNRNCGSDYETIRARIEANDPKCTSADFSNKQDLDIAKLHGWITKGSGNTHIGRIIYPEGLCLRCPPKSRPKIP